MKQLLQLDLINNPVSKLPGYRNTIFTMFPSITILDTLDKVGKDAYASKSMVQAASRVPDALFDKGPAFVAPPPVFAPVAPVGGSIFGPIPKKVTTKKDIAPVVKAPSKASIKDTIKPVMAKKAKTSSKAKMSKAPIKASRSVASQAGLVFPVARINRRFK